MLPMIATAIDLLFNKPKDMFWTGRVMDLLFDGIPIECTSEDFTAKAVCGVFESGDVKAVQPLNDTHFSFSLFQSVSSEEIFDRSIPKYNFGSSFLQSKTNATDLGEFTVFRGKKNSMDIGRVVAFNDEPEMVSRFIFGMINTYNEMLNLI